MIDRDRVQTLRTLRYEARPDGVYCVWYKGQRRVTDPDELRLARRVLGLGPDPDRPRLL